MKHLEMLISHLNGQYEKEQIPQKIRDHCEAFIRLGHESALTPLVPNEVVSKIDELEEKFGPPPSPQAVDALQASFKMGVIAGMSDKIESIVADKFTAPVQ